MATIQEIEDYKSFYTTQLYTNVRKEQKTDQAYIDDTFEVPEIKEPHHIYRSGMGSRIVDSPAENIITSNPQVFITAKKETKTAQASATRWANVINECWIPMLQKQNPNPFKEFVKNLLGRGEGYIKVIHNEKWVTGDKEHYGLPIHFIILDPYVIYSSPEECDEGIPERVIVWYERQYRDVIVKYPFVPSPEIDKQSLVTWTEFYDRSSRYMAAGATPVTNGGVQTNLYGFPPFVRSFSGFGRRNYDGELASLIVSDIRRSRDLIHEECAVRSNLASIDFLFAHRPVTIIGKGLVADDIRDNVNFGSYDLNVIDADPAAIKIQDMDFAPDIATYKHHSDIINELTQRHPFIMAGMALGTSGRQQDMAESAAMRRYDSIMDNTENAFATAMCMAIKECKAIPGLLPDGIKEEDLELDYHIKVKLKAKDPIEDDRKITLGDRLWNMGKGSISLNTFHTQYQGMTEEQSKKEIAKMLADQITIFNPDMAAVMGMVAAEESSMQDWLEKARERRAMMEQGAKGMMEEPNPSSIERSKGEQQTQQGRETAVEPNRGARNAPTNYNRS